MTIRPTPGSPGSRPHRREGTRLLGLAVACLWVSLAAARRAPPSAEEILRRAEDVRSPDISYAADFTIRVVSTSGHVPTHESTYAMVARGKDHTIVLVRTPPMLYGGLLLIAEGHYWLLLPRASTPIQLAPAQIVLGDVATGDIARANLAMSYVPSFQAEEDVDGEPCYRLELGQPRAAASYTRVVYWIAKKGFLPQKLEYYGQTGRLLRSVRYHDYVKGPLGLRPMRLEVQSTQQWEDRSTLTFSNLRPFDAKGVPFTSETMARFRDVAMARMQADGREPSMEELLPLLRR